MGQHDGQAEYRLTLGSCDVRVWQSARDVWTAQRSVAGAAVQRDNLASLAEAQAWCLHQLAAFRRQGACRG